MKQLSSIIDKALCLRRDPAEVRQIALLHLFNGTYVVCDYDRSRVYRNRNCAVGAWHKLVDEYAEAGWGVEPQV